MEKSGIESNNEKKEKQVIENAEVQDHKQTPELNLRPQTGNKQLEFSLTNFPYSYSYTS